MNITGHLAELANRLDREYKTSCADVIDDLNKSASLKKVAQYVGVIGYVLKQNRAMCNCIRRKRASQNGSMQDIIWECLKEYQDGQDYTDTDWHTKYAQIITDEPQQFDSAHLFLLAEIGKENSISQHIEKVRNASNTLKENDIEDELISKILAQADTLGDILSKEADSSVPFRVAATPSRRGWWSRFWNPSEGQAWNPRSWSKNVRSRGEDEDTIASMGTLSQEIVSMSRIAQNIRTDIDRLKGLQSQLSSSPQSLSPGRDSAKTVRTFFSALGELDENNWQHTARVLHNLRWRLKDVEFQDPQNQAHFGAAMQLADDLVIGVQTISESVQNSKREIDSLLSQAPIRGRAHGGMGYGERMVGEFDKLENILNIINRNPLKLEAYAFAKRMLARINDLLRIQSPSEMSFDPGLYDEISSLEDGPQKPGQRGEEVSTGEPIPSTMDVGKKVDDIVKGIEGLGIDPIKSRQLLIQILSSGLPEANSLDILRLVADALKTVSSKKSPPSPPRSQGQSQGSPPPRTPAAPSSKASVPFNPRRHTSSGADVDISDAFKSPASVASSMEIIVKLADVIDKIDPEAALIIDNYLKENRDDIEKMQQMPEFSVLVKENLQE